MQPFCWPVGWPYQKRTLISQFFVFNLLPIKQDLWESNKLRISDDDGCNLRTKARCNVSLFNVSGDLSPTTSSERRTSWRCRSHSGTFWQSCFKACLAIKLHILHCAIITVITWSEEPKAIGVIETKTSTKQRWAKLVRFKRGRVCIEASTTWDREVLCSQRGQSPTQGGHEAGCMAESGSKLVPRLWLSAKQSNLSNSHYLTSKHFLFRRHILEPAAPGTLNILYNKLIQLPRIWPICWLIDERWFLLMVSWLSLHWSLRRQSWKVVHQMFGDMLPQW